MENVLKGDNRFLPENRRTNNQQPQNNKTVFGVGMSIDLLDPLYSVFGLFCPV